MRARRKELQFHQLADLFPPLEGEEFTELVADNKAHGLRKPITLYQGKVLDGCNRYRACREAGVAIGTDEFRGDDPLGFVLSANLHRRHLTESQRAMVAAKLPSPSRGGDRRSDQAANLPVVSRNEAARRLKVSERSVRDAKVVREKGEPRLRRRVEQGEVAVSLAAKVAELPKEEQRKLADADKATLRAGHERGGTARKDRASVNRPRYQAL